MQDFVEHNMSCGDLLAKKSPKSDKIAKMLKEGKAINDCFEIEPGFVGFNLSKVLQLQTWLATSKTVPLDPWSELPLPLAQPELAITEWLNTNIKKTTPSPATPDVDWTDSNWQDSLSECAPQLPESLRLPGSRSIFCPLDGQPVRLNCYGGTPCRLDRLRSPEILDGSPTMLKIHGGLCKKTQNVPIIITTNQPFSRSYKNITTASLEALESVFK